MRINSIFASIVASGCRQRSMCMYHVLMMNQPMTGREVVGTICALCKKIPEVDIIKWCCIEILECHKYVYLMATFRISYMNY